MLCIPFEFPLSPQVRLQHHVRDGLSTVLILPFMSALLPQREASAEELRQLYEWSRNPHSLNTTGRPACRKAIMQSNRAPLGGSMALTQCLLAFWRGSGLYSMGFWFASFTVHNGKIWGLNTTVHWAAQIQSVAGLQEIYIISSVLQLFYGWGRIEFGARNSF